MAKTIEQIREQIQKLQVKEQALLAKEIDGVVARIREAIAHYNLTPERLFGTPSTNGASHRSARSARKAAPRANAPTGNVPAQAKGSLKGSRIAAKYRDDQGNTWTGRGSQPRWLRNALAAGKSLEDFTI